MSIKELSLHDGCHRSRDGPDRPVRLSRTASPIRICRLGAPECRVLGNGIVIFVVAIRSARLLRHQISKEGGRSPGCSDCFGTSENPSGAGGVETRRAPLPSNAARRPEREGRSLRTQEIGPRVRWSSVCSAADTSSGVGPSSVDPLLSTPYSLRVGAQTPYDRCERWALFHDGRIEDTSHHLNEDRNA